MSDFASKFAGQAIVKLLDRLAESITYTTVAGSSSTRTAIVTISDDVTEQWHAVFTIASAAATGVAAPARGDKITYDGNVWTVEGVVPDYAGGHELHAVLPRLTM